MPLARLSTWGHTLPLAFWPPRDFGDQRGAGQAEDNGRLWALH